MLCQPTIIFLDHFHICQNGKVHNHYCDVMFVKFFYGFILALFIKCNREGSGSVVECLTRDRRAAGSSLTGVTALCP